MTVLGALNEGFLQTLKLFTITLLGALPLGLVISFGSMSTWTPFRFLLQWNLPKPLRWLCGIRPISLLTRTVVWIIRGTPLMLQLLILFYIPGQWMASSPWPSGETGRFMAASIAFIINYACYFSEIYRGGIQSIPRGQYEAGQVLGMRRSQIFFRVTLLQLVKRIVPPMGNEMITLVKDTALVRVISVYEIIWMGESFIRKGMMWPLFYTAVFYLAVNGLLTLLLGWFEKKLSYFK